MENRLIRRKPNIKWLKHLAQLLDTQFKFPGTNFRFGIDPIIGLIPFAGDIITLGISTILISYMAFYGASGKLILKMLSLVAIDFLVGLIPIAGQLSDFFIKVNERNIKMYIEYIEEEKHQGSAWPYLIAFLIFIVLFFSLLVYFSFLFIQVIISLF